MGKTKPEERRLLSGYSIDSRWFYGSNECHRLLSWVKLKSSANPNIDDSHLNSHNIIPQPTCHYVKIKNNNKRGRDNRATGATL